MRKLEENDWWPELVAKKDEHSYRELAEMFGATPGAIHRALKRTGHTKKRAPSGPRSARATKPDAPAIPGEYRLRSGTAEKLAPYLDKVGVLADREVSELSGVSMQTIARYRAANGIPSARSQKSPKVAKTAKAAKAAATSTAPKVTKRRPSRVEPFKDLLGTLTDAEIAKMSGVTTNAVTAFRNRLGIGARGRGGARKAPAPSKAPAVEAPLVKVPEAPPATKALLAYRVQLAERSAVVVAPGLVEAARRADAAGEVRSLELLGPVLG